MRDHWRAEEEARDRAAQRYRDSDRSQRRPRTPPFARRADPDDRYRDSESRGTKSYRPADNREPVRDVQQPRPRKASPSPRRALKSKQRLQNSRNLQDRISDPRDPSPTKPSKRKRTRSPSPARSDRYVPFRRRDSRSRDRSEPRDRRAVGNDRAFASRNSPRSKERRSQVPSSDSYISSHRRRDRSRSRSAPHKLDRRSRSPHPRSRSPPARKEERRNPNNQLGDLSPYSARVLKTAQLQNKAPAEPTLLAQKMNHPQRIQSIVGDVSQGQNYQSGHDPMTGPAHIRQNFAPQSNNMMHQNRPPRPPVDSRSSYQGSPPFMTPNSSYHGSPQSGSPYHGNRGGWGGNQQFQGHQG